MLCFKNLAIPLKSSLFWKTNKSPTEELVRFTERNTYLHFVILCRLFNLHHRKSARLWYSASAILYCFNVNCCWNKQQWKKSQKKLLGKLQKFDKRGMGELGDFKPKVMLSCTFIWNVRKKKCIWKSIQKFN